ncbi:hypothetical protein PS404_10570, partial [Pediococcus acidilactici]
KIREDLYINPCNITSIEFNDEYNSTLVTMVNEDVFSLKMPIEKALDAICGSEEHSVEYEDAENYRRDKDLVQKAYVDVNNSQHNHYSIIINSDNAGAEAIVTESEVLSLLDQLKNDETLTIKRSK